jgi:hypothetical protein
VHYSICKALDIEITDKWYTHIQTPKLVCESQDCAVIRNRRAHVDREVTANRPDIIEDKREKTCALIDVAIPAERNFVKKEMEKEIKYKR